MRTLIFLFLLLMSTGASAQTYFNYNQTPFTANSGLQNVGLGSGQAERDAAIHAALALWRAQPGYGPFTPPGGSIVQIVYKDGSREKCVITSSGSFSTSCVLVPGSYEPPAGKATGFGSAGPGYYAWTGTVWSRDGLGDMVVYYGEVGEVTPDPGGGDDTDEP